jgi:hypothetical protein
MIKNLIISLPQPREYNPHFPALFIGYIIPFRPSYFSRNFPVKHSYVFSLPNMCTSITGPSHLISIQLNTPISAKHKL